MFITITLIPILRNVARYIHLVDIPNERKVHTQPIPKVGGIAMAVGVLIPVAMWLETSQFTKALLMGSGIIVLFGIIDDMKEVGYKPKLFGQVLAALVVVFYGGVSIQSVGNILPVGFLLPPEISIPLTVFVIVGVTNAINLSDGLDGLAGGVSMLCFVCIGYLSYRLEMMTVAVFSIAIAGAIFGFLRFNTYPANIFMGDAGSQLLGFLAVTLSLNITQGSTPYSPLLPLLLLGFPILDTLAVMAERVAKGRSPFVADKNHLHHKLIRLGLFHNEAVIIIYILQACLVSSAFILRFYSEWLLLLYYGLFSGAIVVGFTMAERTGWKFTRYDLLDNAIKGKLRVLKDKQIAIRVSFRIVKWGLPLLFFFTCYIPSKMPTYIPLVALLFACIVIWTRLFRVEWMGGAIRVALYLVIPFLAFLAEVNMPSWMGARIAGIYQIAFGVIAIFVIFTLKFTRRRKGFKSTPMDFLILFIALVVPNLADLTIQSFNLGMLTVRVIIFLFGYEVLIGELRKEFDGLALSTVLALLVLAARGVHINL